MATLRATALPRASIALLDAFREHPVWLFAAHVLLANTKRCLVSTSAMSAQLESINPHLARTAVKHAWTALVPLLSLHQAALRSCSVPLPLASMERSHTLPTTHHVHRPAPQEVGVSWVSSLHAHPEHSIQPQEALMRMHVVPAISEQQMRIRELQPVHHVRRDISKMRPELSSASLARLANSKCKQGLLIFPSVNRARRMPHNLLRGALHSFSVQPVFYVLQVCTLCQVTLCPVKLLVHWDLHAKVVYCHCAPLVPMRTSSGWAVAGRVVQDGLEASLEAQLYQIVPVVHGRHILLSPSQPLVHLVRQAMSPELNRAPL
jgi:hypothetical protein